MQQHQKAVFTTLTYNNEHLPPTLDRDHFARFIKRLRERLARSEAGRTIRFFGCGEYGSKTARPHYHALLFGVGESEGQTVQEAWTQGNTLTEKITPERIAYCAGYTAKKYGDERRYREWRMPDGIGRKKIVGWIDEETGEYREIKPRDGGPNWKPDFAWYWQKEFLQMSNRPGIGGFAREKYTQSWKKCAVLNGTTMSVPRYLKDAWKAQATDAEIIKVENEIEEQMITRIMTPEQRAAAKAIHVKRLEMKETRSRKL